MDLQKIPLFAAAVRRLAWLGQRQEVLARNVANADTPGYRPSDLEPLRFSEMVRRQAGAVRLSAPHPGHMGPVSRPAAAFETSETRPTFETAPAGNAVVLEEQMAKVSETSIAHQLVSQVYTRNLGMIRTAIGRPR